MLKQLYQYLAQGGDPLFVVDILNNSTFDEIVELNIEKNTCENIYHVKNKYFVPLLSTTYAEFYEFCLNNMIHQEDQATFANLMNPTDIIDRLNSSEAKGFIFAQFRYKLQNGGWRWVEQCVIHGERFGLDEKTMRFYVFDIQHSKKFEEGLLDPRIVTSTIDKKTNLLTDQSLYLEMQSFIDQLEDVDEWCLVSMDIEHFRLFNDWYGHKTGDLLLSRVGVILNDYQKKHDCLAGYIGQDDFCILIKDDTNLIVQLYDDVHNMITTYGSEFGFSPIFGVCRLAYSQQISTLLDLASVANLAARNVKKRHICYYSSKMREQTEKEYRVLADFKNALANHEMTFFLQPQVRISNEAVIGAEALARWIKPDGSMIMPGDFIPVLEKYGFIVDLDKYIWGEVCAWIKSWLDKGHTAVPISINVSRVDLYSIDVANYLKELVEKNDIDPSLLKVEITESAYADETTTAKDTVDKLREYGFMVLMDDFGSGYSSLNSLGTIKVDAIKLDAKFLAFDDSADSKGLHILEAIINMNKTIGLPMIVEGVEQKKHIEFLSGMGCRYVQGYYYYRPIKIEDFEALISDEKKVDTSGLVFKANEQFQIREFISHSIYSDSMLNNVIGAAAIYLWHKDKKCVDIVRFNQQFYKRVDTTDFSQRLDAIQNYMPSEDVPKMYKLLEEALNDKLNGSSDILRFYKNDGTLTSFILHFYHIGSTEEGHRFFGTAQDVTNIVRIQHQMNLFSQVIAGTIVFLNKRFDKWYFNVAVHGLEKEMHINKTDLEALFNSGDFFSRYGMELADKMELLKQYKVEDAMIEYASKRDGENTQYRIEIHRIHDELSDAEYLIGIRALDKK